MIREECLILCHAIVAVDLLCVDKATCYPDASFNVLRARGEVLRSAEIRSLDRNILLEALSPSQLRINT